MMKAKPMQKVKTFLEKTPNALLCVLGAVVPCGILLPDQPHPAEQNLAAHHDEQRRSAL